MSSFASNWRLANSIAPANGLRNHSPSTFIVPNRVFVGGFDSSTTELELFELFRPFGDVKDIKIIYDSAGASKGYGFITFHSSEDAARILREERGGIAYKEKKLNIGPAIRQRHSRRASHRNSSAAPSTPAALPTPAAPSLPMNHLPLPRANRPCLMPTPVFQVRQPQYPFVPVMGPPSAWSAFSPRVGACRATDLWAALGATGNESIPFSWILPSDQPSGQAASHVLAPPPLHPLFPPMVPFLTPRLPPPLPQPSLLHAEGPPGFNFDIFASSAFKGPVPQLEGYPPEIDLVHDPHWLERITGNP